jgi:uncharacterized protein (DUF433 family)
MAIAFGHLVKSPHGETHITGRRISAYDILCRHQLGDDAPAIAASFDLPLAAVYEALAYALDHPDEMDRLREADEAAGQHALAGAPTNLDRDTAPS